jgi:hypothetical protein
VNVMVELPAARRCPPSEQRAEIGCAEMGQKDGISHR